MHIDEHTGRQLFRRRRMLGLTQTQLGDAVGIRFQQVQKYECGATRMTAGRLFDLAVALGVSTDYFFEGLVRPEQKLERTPVDAWAAPTARMISHIRSRDLSKGDRKLGARPHRQLLKFVSVLQQETSDESNASRRVDLDLDQLSLWAPSR